MKQLIALCLLLWAGLSNQSASAQTNGVITAEYSVRTDREVYTSSIPGVLSDADITCGSNLQDAVPCTTNSYGTDTTNSINAVLNGGNVHLIVDGKYSLSSALTIYSNTRITVLPGNGFVMRPGSNSALAMNAHSNAPTLSAGKIPRRKKYGPGFLVSNITDSNIAIEGGIWNSNSLNATTGPTHRGAAPDDWVYGIKFEGVDNLIVQNIYLWDSPTFGLYFANTRNVRVDGDTVQNPDVYNNWTKNTDCVHFVGPAQYISISNEHLTCGDDSVALNANDGPGLHPLHLYGPITDAWIDNIFLDGCQLGLRLVSMSAPVDRIHIHHITGTTYRAYFNANSEPMEYPTNNNGGYFGTVEMSDWNVRRIDLNPATSANSELEIAARFQSMTIENVDIENPNSRVERGSILHVYNYPIVELNLRNWKVNNPKGNDSINPIIKLDSKVHNLHTADMTWVDSPTGTGYFYGGPDKPIHAEYGTFTGPVDREFAKASERKAAARRSAAIAKRAKNS